MRKPLEMITNLRMQNIMEIRKKNNLFRDQITFSEILKNKFWGTLGVESPHGGAIMQPSNVSDHGSNSFGHGSAQFRPRVTITSATAQNNFNHGTA